MIASNWSHIKQRIQLLEEELGYSKNSIQLLAASKGQSVEKIKAAYDAGQRSFGENYLQEALQKMQMLKDLEIEWHFIGKIQKNKIKKIAKHFDWVQSVSDLTIANLLNEHRPIHFPPLNICIEINISNEISKSGTSIENLQTLAMHCSALTKLKLRGLMTIPSIHDSQDNEHLAFKKMRMLFKQLNNQNLHLDTLSMGMSHDFEAAIRNGSTMVRVGTLLFGPRA